MVEKHGNSTKKKKDIKPNTRKHHTKNTYGTSIDPNNNKFIQKVHKGHWPMVHKLTFVHACDQLDAK